MVNCTRLLILNCIFWSAAAVCAEYAYSGDLEDGVAFVTTHMGEVTFTDSNGRNEKAELHALKSLSRTIVTTGPDGQIFFSLSNGIALSIYTNSEVRFESYRQMPYLASKDSLEYEPSRSELVIELTSGSLSFDTERISPLSEIVFKLPNGKIRPHKSSGRIVYDTEGAHISILSGIVSFDYPDYDEQEFINGPDIVRISDQSASGRRIASTLTPETDPTRELTERLVEATRRSNQRVFFKVLSETASIPRPVLIAKPEDLKQPSPRPYQYLDQ